MTARPPAARVALIGAPQCGRTTLFSCLSGIAYDRCVHESARGLHTAHVPVDDPRLRRAKEIENSQAKISYALLEITDTPALGLTSEDAEKNAQTLGQLRDADAYIVVLGDHNGAGTMDQIRSTLQMADLDVLMRRIDTVEKKHKRPLPAAEKEEGEKELAVLRKLGEGLAAGKTVGALAADEEKRLRTFQLFSRKPMVVVANVSEANLRADEQDRLVACLALERDLLALEGAEREEFRSMYGLTELVRDRLIHRVYRDLQLISFLTIGPTEIVAWPLKRGQNAVDAADRIHTDIAKGFINAEVIPWADWEKSAGRAKERLEGKTYLIQDGDVLHIRFSK